MIQVSSMLKFKRTQMIYYNILMFSLAIICLQIFLELSQLWTEIPKSATTPE